MSVTMALVSVYSRKQNDKHKRTFTHNEFPISAVQGSEHLLRR